MHSSVGTARKIRKKHFPFVGFSIGFQGLFFTWIGSKCYDTELNWATGKHMKALLIISLR